MLRISTGKLKAMLAINPIMKCFWDFEEFLWAKGYDDSTVEDMLEHMRTLKPFNEVEMAVYSELFLDYCILGGMPAVVREFVEKGTFEGSLEVHRDS